MLPDEGRYVGVAWEMIRSGDWSTPALNGLPFLHKPPLFYWITAAAMSAFGAGELAARAAPVIGASLGAMSMYYFTQRWCGDRTARFVLIALLVQPLFYLGGQFANLDMQVAGSISATILLGAHAALKQESGQPYHRYLLAAYAMAAIGVLAKGLIGAVIPAVVLICWLMMRGQWPTLRSFLSLAGMAVFLGLSAPWFLLMQWRFPGFLDYIFVVQHFQRFTTGGFNNALPYWFFAAVLLVLSLPWLPWLFRLFSLRHVAHPRLGSVRLLMVLWVVLVVAFFSIPQSKLIGYVIPAVPPLAFLIGDGFATLARPTRMEQQIWWSGAVIAMTVNIATVIVLTIRPLQSARDLAIELSLQRRPQEPVFMVSHYYYDLPIYARLEQSVSVVGDWSSPDVLVDAPDSRAFLSCRCSAVAVRQSPTDSIRSRRPGRRPPSGLDGIPDPEIANLTGPADCRQPVSCAGSRRPSSGNPGATG